jgi:hypothetical protein
MITSFVGTIAAGTPHSRLHLQMTVVDEEVHTMLQTMNV